MLLFWSAGILCERQWIVFEPESYNVGADWLRTAPHTTRYIWVSSQWRLASFFTIWPREKCGQVSHFCSWVTGATRRHRKVERTQNSFRMVPFCTQKTAFSSEISWYFTAAIIRHSSLIPRCFYNVQLWTLWRQPMTQFCYQLLLWVLLSLSLLTLFLLGIALCGCPSPKNIHLCWTSALTKKKLKRLIRFWMSSWPANLLVFLIGQIPS